MIWGESDASVHFCEENYNDYVAEIFNTTSSIFYISQYVTTSSTNWITLIAAIFYGLMYWIAVILGTARQARSAVLLANKLPARNFL